MKKVIITVSFEVDAQKGGNKEYKFTKDFVSVVADMVRNIRHNVSDTRFEVKDCDGNYNSVSPTNVVVVAKKG
jgi:hypothetical protein